ncbi:hypothetical protein CVT24_012882 [Panaeolus cyanescens]|uniref:Uncharacterized protein n=1 Tax=Panaeolus cyanescens TaxID=181874 RepID=A0A409W2X4_9AGAR|nr:hypothetical protein CVT24_012882 [Panaeolus cyanescens]
MRFITSLAFVLAALTSLVLSSPNPGKRATVNLRIEGEDSTIFEGSIRTRGHDITTAQGGTHHCDGTNNNENPHPGPTCTSALADAAHEHGFGFDGPFFTDFDDYLISTIGSESNTATQFWTLFLNSEVAQVGGCQQQVKTHDEVLWAFDGFGKTILKLSGPKTAKVNKKVLFIVKDGQTGAAVAGASVEGGLAVSDADGKVWVKFGSTGVKGVKAEKDSSVRSNAVVVRVTP